MDIVAYQNFARSAQTTYLNQIFRLKGWLFGYFDDPIKHYTCNLLMTMKEGLLMLEGYRRVGMPSKRFSSYRCRSGI